MPSPYTIAYWGNTDLYETATSRSLFTASGFCAFSPWSDPSYSSSVLQLSLGWGALRRANASYFYSALNTASDMFRYDNNREKNYNLRSNFRVLQQVASGDFTANNGGLSDNNRAYLSLKSVSAGTLFMFMLKEFYQIKGKVVLGVI